ncbi:helix-turn-helix domain-containing protein [Paenibacillus sp. HJGM_3]|uniref:helix-turn-helix domain-containing protein n=1 Tax=Paenibacillus sp. HJGM_3 TaxID=3379816 RepID=UPI00385CFA06
MIGDRIKSLRKGKGLTQEEAAKRLKMIRSTYSNYENGNREPDFETAEKIAEFYGVDVNYLLGKFTNDQAKNAVLEAYTRLPQDKRKIIDEMIKALSE